MNYEKAKSILACTAKTGNLDPELKAAVECLIRTADAKVEEMSWEEHRQRELRDMFAAYAMSRRADLFTQKSAQEAYRIADMMLAERRKK